MAGFSATSLESVRRRERCTCEGALRLIESPESRKARKSPEGCPERSTCALMSVCKLRSFCLLLAQARTSLRSPSCPSSFTSFPIMPPASTSNKSRPWSVAELQNLVERHDRFASLPVSTRWSKVAEVLKRSPRACEWKHGNLSGELHLFIPNA